MPSGTVKWFNAEKGYGFIRPAEGGDDVFVHISALQAAGFETLPDGQPVIYELITDRRGRVSAGELALDGEMIEAPARPPRRDFGDRPPRDYGDRGPRGGGDRGPRGGYGDRDRGPRGGGYGDRGPRGPRRDVVVERRDDGGPRGPRRDFGDRPPREGGGRRDFGDRPPRGDYGDRPPRGDYGDRPPRGEFRDRPPRGGGGGGYRDGPPPSGDFGGPPPDGEFDPFGRDRGARRGRGKDRDRDDDDRRDRRWSDDEE